MGKLHRTGSKNQGRKHMPDEPAREQARQQDRSDPLVDFRARFVISDPEMIYMDGNSLGRLPLATARKMKQVVAEEWGENLIRSWGTGWYTLPQELGDKVGAILGAAPGQVVVSDSTSVNLYKLAMAALQLKPERTDIVTDSFNFPSDLYILQGCASQLGRGHQLRLVHSADALHPASPEIFAAVNENTALVSLSHVAFKSGCLYDMQAITQHAHEKGALVLWDLSHSAGVVPLELDAWSVDFAVGCTYKYLNGGPGAPAYLYVRREHQEKATSPIWGWFGEHSPFAFGLEYQPAPGIRRFLAGTPPVLSLQAVGPGLDLILEAGLAQIRRKSVALTGFLISLADEYLAPLGFELASPRRAEARGSHVSLRHPEGYRINRALIGEMKVIPDFREPDNIRFGVAPLYTTFAEVLEAVLRTARVVEERRYLGYPEDRSPVT
jgi:kynureninase